MNSGLGSPHVHLLHALENKVVNTLVLSCFLNCGKLQVQLLMEELLDRLVQELSGLAKDVALCLESDETGQILSLISNEDNVADYGADVLETVLNLTGRDILSTSCDHQLLLSASDLQQTLLVKPAYVSAVEVPLRVKHLHRLFLVVQVTQKDVPALHAYLSHSVLVRVEDLDLSARQGHSHLLQILKLAKGRLAQETFQESIVKSNSCRGLTQTVAIDDGHIERLEEGSCSLFQRSRS